MIRNESLTECIGKQKHQNNVENRISSNHSISHLEKESFNIKAAMKHEQITMLFGNKYILMVKEKRLDYLSLSCFYFSFKLFSNSVTVFVIV